jgi:hypothetical protein
MLASKVGPEMLEGFYAGASATPQAVWRLTLEEPHLPGAEQQHRTVRKLHCVVRSALDRVHGRDMLVNSP